MPINEDKYLYPRVKISQHVLSHSSVGPAIEDTTVLFAPIYTSKGPAGLCKSNIHSLTEFVEIYGGVNKDFYLMNGQLALMIYNWLHNGGTVCVYRLTCGESKCEAKFTFETTEEVEVTNTVENETTHEMETVTTIETRPTTIEKKICDAKYEGNAYAKTSITIIPVSSTVRRIIVKYDDVRVEQFPRVTKDNYSTVLKNSEYIGDLTSDFKTLVFDTEIKDEKKGITVEFKYSGNGKVDYATVINYMRSFYGEELTEEVTVTDANEQEVTTEVPAYVVDETIYDVLNNRLDPNVDIILDAGYDLELKEDIRKFLADREDIFGIFDLCELGTEKPGYIKPEFIDDPEDIQRTPVEVEKEVEGQTTTVIELEDLDISVFTNVAVYEQYFTIYDSTFTDTELYVTPTYFLSRLIPFTDNNYGIQFPVAGLRRAILVDALSVNLNPDADTKDDWFRKRINYVEKSPREYAFMSQRTFDNSSEDDYTALSFINNARTLERIKKEIRTLGREYLFEFNDSTTLAQMQNVLSKYINNWISNRTLATGTVDVRRNAYSDEAVDVTISVRFNGTIEIISVDITIE